MQRDIAACQRLFDFVLTMDKTSFPRETDDPDVCIWVVMHIHFGRLSYFYRHYHRMMGHVQNDFRARVVLMTLLFAELFRCICVVDHIQKQQRQEETANAINGLIH